MITGHRLAGVLATLVVIVGPLVSACSPLSKPEPDVTDDPFALQTLEPVEIDVDTPELRAAKKAAGIETCVPGSGDRVTDGAPEITLPCLGGGQPVDLASLRGPLVINMWGAWCAPCREELPVLAAFYDKYGDRVSMLGVDFQETQPEAALQLAADSGITYPQVSDEGGALVRTSVMPGEGVPSLTFIDETGEVVAWVPGQVRSEQELVDLVNEHLGLNL